MPDDHHVISSARLGTEDITRHQFSVVRRGFDPQEVRSFLDTVSREIERAEQRIEELREELSLAQIRARNPVIDETMLTSGLGAESARVLREAHDEAAQLTARAEEAAATMVREAQRQASDLQVNAEATAAQRIAEAEIAVGALARRADNEARAIIEAASREAEATVEQAKVDGRGLIERSQAARRRVLADAAQRRRVLQIQIEQLRAARDQLAHSVRSVRTEADQLVGALERADDEARFAAAEVQRTAPAFATREDAEALHDAELEIPLAPSSLMAAEPGLPALADEGPDTAGGDEPAADAASAQLDEEAELEPAGPAPAAEPTVPRAEGAGANAAELLVAEEPAEGEPIALDDAADREEDVLPHGAPEDVSEAAQGEQASFGDIEELFARLRSHQPAVAEVAGQEPAGMAVAVAVTASEHEHADGAEVAPIEVTEVDIALLEAAPVEAEEPDVALRDQRAALLDPITARLARQLKRVLQDDQNRLLDGLRSGAGTVASLLNEEEQLSLFSSAARTTLSEGLQAGIEFAAQTGASNKVDRKRQNAIVDAASSDLAATITTLLRRRLDPDGDGAADEEPAERVGAAYREWRGERVERLVGDYALGVFSAGVLAAAGTDVPVRWIVEAGKQPCADCEDNALNEPIEAGATFPTGHQHPPAHPGCRCLVVPHRA
jgi:DivIVA domain-containing protein